LATGDLPAAGAQRPRADVAGLEAPQREDRRSDLRWMQRWPERHPRRDSGDRALERLRHPRHRLEDAADRREWKLGATHFQLADNGYRLLGQVAACLAEDVTRGQVARVSRLRDAHGERRDLKLAEVRAVYQPAHLLGIRDAVGVRQGLRQSGR